MRGFIFYLSCPSVPEPVRESLIDDRRKFIGSVLVPGAGISDIAPDHCFPHGSVRD